MVDHGALTDAVTEACALDPAYAGPNDNFLVRLPGFGLAMAARNRIMRGLVDHSNTAGLFGLLLPCGDGAAETFDLEMAADWLIWEANRRPASEVVADFAYFLDHRDMEGLKVELIHGLQIETSIDLGASLRLEPFAKLPPVGRTMCLPKGASSNATASAAWAIRLLQRSSFRSRPA